jgi:hypothetical protein
MTEDKNTIFVYPRLSLSDETALREAMYQLGDIINMAAGDLEGCTAVEQVDETRAAVAAAMKVVTKWRRKAVASRRASNA